MTTEDRGDNWVDRARATISDIAAAKGHDLQWAADEPDELRSHRTPWWRATCTKCGEPKGTPPQRNAKEMILPQDPAENADHWLGDNEHLPTWLNRKCSEGRTWRRGPQPVPVPRIPRPEPFGERQAVSGYTGLTDRSAMIYLDLPEGTVHHLPGGVDDHHITLVYLGKNVSDAAFAAACRRAEIAAAGHHPMDGVIGGLDSFPPSDSSKGKVPVFVPAYVPTVGKLRRELEDLSASEHTQYKPHVTLAYLEPGEKMPAPHPPVKVRFTHLNVKRGDDVVSFPLGRPE